MIEFKADKKIKAKHIILVQKSGDDLELMLKFLGEFVKSWDLVDENGKSLPNPNENPDSVFELSVEQIKELSESFMALVQVPKTNGSNS